MKTLLKFLEEKGITIEKFDEMTPAEQRKLHNELSELNTKAFTDLTAKMKDLTSGLSKDEVSNLIAEATSILTEANKAKDKTTLDVLETQWFFRGFSAKKCKV